MSQSSFIAGALIAAFVLFIAVRGRYPVYAAVLWGPAPQESGSGSGSGSGFDIGDILSNGPFDLGGIIPNIPNVGDMLGDAFGNIFGGGR